MTQSFFAALNFPVLVAVVTLALALETALFHIVHFTAFQPDLWVIAVVWAALKRGFIEGGILTLVLAHIVEIHTASPQGLVLCTAMGTFLLIRWMAKLFVLPGQSAWVSLVILAGLLSRFSGLAILQSTGHAQVVWSDMLLRALPGLGVLGVIATWAFPRLERFDWVTFKNRRAKQALADEMPLEDF